MAFIRRIKKGGATYLAKVESYREDGKVKQRVLEYVGKEENGVPPEFDTHEAIEALQCKLDGDFIFQTLKM